MEGRVSVTVTVSVRVSATVRVSLVAGGKMRMCGSADVRML